MRVLFVTNNSFLRSTSCSLDAVIGLRQEYGLSPVMLFRERGPWQELLQKECIPCYFDPLDVPNKRQPLKSLSAIWRISRILKRERIDIIHCNEHDNYPLIRVAARYAHVPTLVAFRFTTEPEFGQWAFRYPYRPDAVQFTSRFQLEACRGTLPPDYDCDRVYLFMNGRDFRKLNGIEKRDATRAKWRTNSRTFVFGTASAIRPRKRIEDFVDLIARLRGRGHCVSGVIAGGGRFANADYVEMLQRRIQEKDLLDHCIMIGEVPDIGSFMHAIDAFVSTSALETFGMSVCEAMACGRPAIGYVGGSVGEVVPDSWCVVRNGDIDALTERALRLIEDRQFYDVIAEQGQKHVYERFDAPVLAKRQMAIYRSVLNRSMSHKPKGR